MTDRDREYSATYTAWVASLPAAQRAKLAADGLDKPHVDGTARNVALSADAADLANAIAEHGRAKHSETVAAFIVALDWIGAARTDAGCRLRRDVVRFCTDPTATASEMADGLDVSQRYFDSMCGEFRKCGTSTGSKEEC